MTPDYDPIVALRRERRRRHRWANLTFLLAGIGFGSAAYVARTRPLTGRLGMWMGVVGAGVALFGVAAWLHGRAQRIDEELRRRLEESEAEPREKRGD
jgi:hypothetical protein